MNKECFMCKTIKDSGEFYARTASKDGLHSYCKKCCNSNWNNYKVAHRERLRQYVKEYNARPESKEARRVYLNKWYKDSPRQNLRTCLKAALKRKPTVNPITLDELCELFSFQNGRCAVSGLQMTWRLGSLAPTSISVDRIDSNIGYVRENVRLVCFSVNVFRGRMTDNELFDMALAIVSNMRKPRLRSVS